MDHGAGWADDVLARLIRGLDDGPVSHIADTAFEVLADSVGVKRLWLYVADFAEVQLLPVPGRLSDPPPSPLAVDGSPAGAAFLDLEPVEEDRPEGPTLWIPLHRRSEVFGVAGIGADSIGPELHSIATPLSLVLGAEILESRRYSDTYEVIRGARQLELAAAMQWSLLPLPNYADPRLEIAGRLEPAYDVGGDAFDFAVNSRSAEVCVLDAMGHGLQSTLLSQLAVGAYRFSRRRRDDLGEVATDVDQAVAIYGSGERFVTGVVCRLSLIDGTLDCLVAGHPPPLVVRDGQTRQLAPAQPMLPFGLGGAPCGTVREVLEPGDVLVLFSDGLIEARPQMGEGFGMERFTQRKASLLKEGTPLSTAVRRILDEVLEHAGHGLPDDATLLAMRWNG